MKSAIATANVDYRLLGQLSDLVVCSRCLKRGKATPVPRVSAPGGGGGTLCASCTRPGRQRDLRQILKTLIAP
jgi:hypothetical protein